MSVDYLGVQRSSEENGLFLGAGISIYLYDYTLTFSEEIKYVWMSPFSAVKVLFLLNRYIPLIIFIPLFFSASGLVGVSAHVCQKYFVTEGTAMIFLFASWSCLTAIRVHALYGLQRNMKFGLSIGALIALTLSLGLAIHYLTQISRGAMVFEDLRFCYPGPIPRFFFTIWVPTTALEVVMFVLAMAKLLNADRLRNNGLHRMLMRDGLLYFVAIMGFRLSNLAFSARGDQQTIYYSLFLMIGAGSAVVSRFVLNLRSWSRKSKFYKDDAGTRFAPTSPSEPIELEFRTTVPNHEWWSVKSDQENTIVPESRGSSERSLAKSAKVLDINGQHERLVSQLLRPPARDEYRYSAAAVHHGIPTPSQPQLMPSVPVLPSQSGKMIPNPLRATT